MDPAIRAWLQAVVAAEDERAQYVQAQKATILAAHGGRFVGWTGGGGPDHNRIYDLDTGQTLLIIPDGDPEAFGEVLAENNWHIEDPISMSAAAEVPDPPPPDGYPDWLFTDDLDPDRIRAWLDSHPA